MSIVFAELPETVDMEMIEIEKEKLEWEEKYKRLQKLMGKLRKEFQKLIDSQLTTKQQQIVKRCSLGKTLPGFVGIRKKLRSLARKDPTIQKIMSEINELI